MKKASIKQILLIAFAAIAVYTACMPGSVAVYDLTQAREPFRCTYFTLVEGVTGGFCLPLAGLCSCVTLLMSGIYVAAKKQNLLSGIKILSMVGAILAVVPILIKGTEIMLVPNVLLPIALLCEYVAAGSLQKKESAPVVELKGKRL